MKTMRFKVAPGPHAPQLAIQAHDLTLNECQLVRGVVTNQWIDTLDYQLGHEAGVYLQGYQEPSRDNNKDGWVLVEFWSDDRKAIDAWVEHLNYKMEGM